MVHLIFSANDAKQKSVKILSSGVAKVGIYISIWM